MWNPRRKAIALETHAAQKGYACIRYEPRVPATVPSDLSQFCFTDLYEPGPHVMPVQSFQDAFADHQKQLRQPESTCFMSTSIHRVQRAIKFKSNDQIIKFLLHRYVREQVWGRLTSPVIHPGLLVCYF
jgi:hypothetical protein